MSTATFRVVAAIVTAGMAWAATSSANAIACAERPLTPKSIVKKNITGKATVEFSVGEVYLMPASWAASSNAGWKATPLHIVPKDATMKDPSLGGHALFYRVTVVVS